MKRSIGFIVLTQAIFAAMATAQSVTITFTGTPSSTPAPSTWMLMGLGLLLAFFVFRKAHSLPGGHITAALLMLIGVSAYEVFTGSAMASKASAIPVGTVQESITSGNSITVNGVDDTGADQEQFINNTGGSITITSVTTDEDEDIVTPPSSPQCQIGTVLAIGGSCYVQIEGDS